MLADLPPVFAHALIGVTALALLVLFWRSLRGGGAGDTAVMRIGLILLLAPFVAAAVIGLIHEQPGADRTRQAEGRKPEARQADVKQPEAKQPGATGPSSGSRAPVGQAPVAQSPAPQAPATQNPAPRSPSQQQSAPPAAVPPPPPVATAPPVSIPPPPAPSPSATVQPPRQEVVIPPPPPPPAPTATAEPAGGAAPAPTRSSPAAPTSAPARSSEPWDVVPVYYGTDRNVEPGASRLSYGSERARRLELGRALVTVPKIHEVPNVERPWVYRLPFTRIILFQEAEDPARHFTLKEIKAMSPAELGPIVRDRLAASSEFKDQALVFLHGFNNSFEGALFRTAQIAYDLKFDGAPFLYSWPSKGQIGFQDYSYDRESSGQAEPYLRQFLEFVTRETGAKSVNIIAHSMGNQLLLNVLRDLKRNAPGDVRIGQVILAAPDVDRDTFEFIAREIAGIGQGMTILAASNDRALEASKRFWGGVPRAGDVPVQGPVVVAGIDTIDITALSTEVLSLNHNGYAQKHQLIDDLRTLLRSGIRPPSSRVPTLELVTTEKGAFWRYPMK
jgi:esterase/lipase superfamily enzyme